MYAFSAVKYVPVVCAIDSNSCCYNSFEFKMYTCPWVGIADNPPAVPHTTTKSAVVRPVMLAA